MLAADFHVEFGYTGGVERIATVEYDGALAELLRRLDKPAVRRNTGSTPTITGISSTPTAGRCSVGPTRRPISASRPRRRGCFTQQCAATPGASILSTGSGPCAACQKATRCWFVTTAPGPTFWRRGKKPQGATATSALSTRGGKRLQTWKKNSPRTSNGRRCTLLARKLRLGAKRSSDFWYSFPKAHGSFPSLGKLSPKSGMWVEISAVKALVNLGSSAVPGLVAHLYDRRLTRVTVGPPWDPHRLLRVQDLALYCLERLLAKQLYLPSVKGPWIHLSAESESQRKVLIGEIEKSVESLMRKPPAEGPEATGPKSEAPPPKPATASRHPTRLPRPL